MNVAQLFVHPVKSLAGIAVDCFDIDRFGPRWDRRWMVVDEQGKFITQRQCVAMARVHTALTEEGLRLSCDGEAVNLSRRACEAGAVVGVQVWRDQCQGHLAPDAVNDWLSRMLQRPCRVVFMADNTVRPVDPDYAKAPAQVSFADGFPLLLTSEASLQQFNQWLGFDIEMKRFRPNVVVSGAAPWDEDAWQVVRIGDTVFDVVKPCSRCAIPTIDPATTRKQPEVFQALKQHRSRDGAVYFGQNLIPRSQGRLSLRDTVEVIERG